MEQSISMNFFLWIIGAIATILCGCWAIFKYFEHQMNTVYKRLDENKKSYYNDFVLKEVLKQSNEDRKTIVDEKFNGMILLFNEKFESLRREIQSIGNPPRNHKP